MKTIRLFSSQGYLLILLGHLHCVAVPTLKLKSKISDKMPARRAAAAAGVAKAKAFKRPSPKQMSRLWAEAKSNDKYGVIATSPANNNLSPNNQDIRRYHFVDLYRNDGHCPVHPSIVEVYIQFICEYVNRFNKRNAAGQVPVCAVKDGSFFKKFHDAFLGQSDTSAGSVQLTQNGLGPANFLQLRHLFLPDRSFTGHMALIVISPEARTVDYLDSAIPRSDEKMGVVLRLISDHLGDLFVPHEWKVRQGYSPLQYRQRDCAIYTALNAMFIAFGYPTEYTRSDMLNRRYRMAVDLLNGSRGMFYMPTPGEAIAEADEPSFYELTDYWTGDKASDRSRGFESLTEIMFFFLPEDVKAKARAGRYREEAE